jgi:hypothetical protein
MKLRLKTATILLALPFTVFAQQGGSEGEPEVVKPEEASEMQTDEKDRSGGSEGGLFYSTWGIGVQGGYNFTNEILFGGDVSSQSTSSSGGSTGTTIEVETNIQTVNAYARYYLRDLEFTDGLFGQAGLAFRNWNGTGTITEEKTKAKLASIKMNWSPMVLVTGVGWHKVWSFGMSTAISFNASIGGSRTVEYTENMLRFSDATKSNLEENTDFPTNFVIYIGYSF